MNDCEHLANGMCAIASQLAGVAAATHPSSCSACTLDVEPHRNVNYVTVSLAATAIPNERDRRAFINKYVDFIPSDNGQSIGLARLERVRAGTGPGSQLWRLLESLGVQHTNNCPCLSFAERMNAWGVAGCREHRAQIVEHMRINAKRYGWSTIAAAAAKAVLTGVAFRLSPIDPYGSLLDEALRRVPPDPDPIDILLPLGPGSRYDNVEIRLALRSIAEHAVGVRRVVVLGSIPTFLRSTESVEFVPLREFRCNKASRISQKVLWAFQHLDLTPTIAFWNDDYLMLRNLDIRTIPNHCHGQLWRKPKNHWNRLLNHTGEALRDAGFPARHFDIHVPILYEREKWLAIADWWERSRQDRLGLVAKSIYGNIHCQGTEVRTNDAKLQANWKTRIDDLASRRWILSYGDGALASGFAEWMSARFPIPTASEVMQAPTRPRKRSARRRRAERCC